MIAAVALQGMIFAVVKALIQRGGARTWKHFLGVWPGEKRPDPS